MTQVLDIVKGALRSIGALEAGEDPDADTANDCLNTLNDMIAQWSNASMMIPYTTEIIYPLTNGQATYTIGDGGTMAAVFTGSISSTTLTITSLASGGINLLMSLRGTGITTGTKVVAFVSGAGGVSGAAGTYTVDTAQTAASTTITGSYQRPLRISSAFTRVAGLDYPCAVMNVQDYELIGLKTLPGPWPQGFYYQPSVELGNISFWPVPNAACEAHLFVDTSFVRYTSLSDIVRLPPGYNVALRWGLAELLMPEFGTASHDTAELVLRYAAQSKGFLKRTNMQPQPKVQFDAMLANNNRTDAGWILSGGFR